MRRRLVVTLLVLVGLVVWAVVGRGLLAAWLLPAWGEGPGLLVQRWDTSRPQAPPSAPYREPRTVFRFSGEHFFLRMVGILWVTRPGWYGLGVASDDNSHLYIDGRFLIDNAGHRGTRLKTTRAWLSPGPHLVEVQYDQDVGRAELRILWRPPGGRWEPIPPSALSPLRAPLDRRQAVRVAAAAEAAEVPWLLAGMLLAAVGLVRLWWGPGVVWRHYAGAAAALVVGVWLSSGTLAPYAITSAKVVEVPPCGWLANIDHQHFQALFWMLDGDPMSKWGFSEQVRRILYPVLAYPLMKLYGFLGGGLLTTVGVYLVSLWGWGLFLWRRVGPVAAGWGLWLLTTWPGVTYWAGLPYPYVMIVPCSLWGFLILVRLQEPATWPVVAGCGLGLGVLMLAYDLMPYFGLAAAVLVLWRGRAPLKAAVVLALAALPSAAWLGVMRFGLGLSLYNPNTSTYVNLVHAYLSPGDWDRWAGLLARAPWYLLYNYFASGLMVLPALFLVLWVWGRWRLDERLWPAEAVLLACVLMVFLFNSLAPPYQGRWVVRGEYIARLYQPAFVAMLCFVVRLAQRLRGVRSGWRRLVAGLLLAAVVLDGAVVVGPWLWPGVSSFVYGRFYRHGHADSLERHLARYGRRPYGVCAPLAGDGGS